MSQFLNTSNQCDFLITLVTLAWPNYILSSLIRPDPRFPWNRGQFNHHLRLEPYQVWPWVSVLGSAPLSPPHLLTTSIVHDFLFILCVVCVCGSWEFSGPPLSPLIHINHLLEFFAPLSSGGFDRFIVCLHINMYPPSQKLLQFVPVTTCADFSLLQTIHLCIANEYLLCFLVTQVIQNLTKSTLWPPNVIHSYRQHHLGNPIHLIHLLISWTDILDSTVRLLCLACHTIRSGVRVITHTHAPPHLHNSQTLRKYSFLRLSIPSFALGGLVNTPGGHYHDDIHKTHPSCLSTNEISPYCLVPLFAGQIIFSWTPWGPPLLIFCPYGSLKMLFPKMFTYPHFWNHTTLDHTKINL